MVDELDRVRQQEHRTRSELVREALRRYVRSRGRYIKIEQATPDEIAAIRQAEQELGQGETMRLEDLQRELGLPTR